MIAESVAHDHGLTFADLAGRSRKKHIVAARYSAIRLVRAVSSMSYPQIGRMFNRDHTTVMHALGVLGRQRKKQEAQHENA